MAPKVGIIGCGIAGPVLASFLKLKGYEPAVYERYDAPNDTGLSIGLQPNGMEVLAMLPGLLEYVDAYPVDELQLYSVVSEDKGFIGSTDHPRVLREKDGLGVRSCRRGLLQRRLTEYAAEKGVPVHWSHKMESLEQDDKSVTVLFANGVRETFSFVVGCDGLHSQTRNVLFGEQPATYTGLSSWGGTTPTPEIYRGKKIVADIYGNGAHMIVIPMDDETTMWALTQREPEARETWRAIDKDAEAAFKTSPFAEWDFGAGEAIKNSTKIIKYGLYLRPELPVWHKGRVVLIGDAAHPTSPHVGQGANQAFEDIDLLVELLDRHNPGAEEPTSATLDALFTELGTTRIPRTSEMIKRALKQGETRVAQGLEACLARNNFYREAYKKGDIAKVRLGA